MNYKSKTDEELVYEAGRARQIDSAPIEMMRRLKHSITFSSWVMIVLTFVLVVLTGVLIWQGFK